MSCSTAKFFPHSLYNLLLIFSPPVELLTTKRIQFNNLEAPAAIVQHSDGPGSLNLLILLKFRVSYRNKSSDTEYITIDVTQSVSRSSLVFPEVGLRFYSVFSGRESARPRIMSVYNGK